LKFDAVIVRDAEGERRLGLPDLPLRIGTGGDCEIRLPGPGSSAVALLDALDGQPFLQPVGRGAALRLNGETLAAARRLADGDSVEFYGTRIEFRAEGTALVLAVRLEDSAYITRPPELPGAAGQPGEEAIAPTAFRRAADVAPAPPERHSYGWQAGVAIGIAVLVAVSFLLFTSRSIEFEVLPAGVDELSISGGWFQLPLADRVLLRQGTYSVRVQKEGYFEANQSFEVGDEPSRTITIEMRKLPGFVTVATDPAVEATVTVDGTLIGDAPFGPLELEPGTHTIEVSAERYLPYVDQLPVPGLGGRQVVDVQLVPRWADVQIATNPPGAEVIRDETVLGRTPVSLELLEGNHDLVVILEGYKAWDTTVEARANEDIVLPVVDLEPANAQLTVNTIPRSANVTVDGRYRGQSPVKLALSPDTDYRIGLSKAGYGSTERSVRLRSGASESITVDLAARTGKVTIAALPGDARILIDGRDRGSGTMTFDLSSAPHELEVRMDGYQSFKRDFTPRPGYPQTIQVRLLSEEEIRQRSIAAATTNSQGQELRRIEPGTFTMGASRSEQGRRANEVIVPVTLTKPFFIGAKEVTNREYARFRPNHDSGSGVHAALAGDNNPVVNISWEDAVDYLNWLSTQEGLTPAYQKRFEKWEPVMPVPNGYRLPTEAEWVWAIRYQGRPVATRFPWGNDLPPRRDSGNYADQSARQLVPSLLPGYDDGFASTAPVGSFPANALGIYDGGGNVAEWVQDYYAVPQPGLTEALVDPMGPSRGSYHVIRGSSWRHAGVTELRGSYRDFGNDGRIDVGFRIARNID